ncbi:MAG: helix-turn-helix domain-containing protein [Mycobacterium sp.]
MKPATVRRWDARLADADVAGLLAERKGPKRKSKLTGDTIAAIRRLREEGSSYCAIATATGVLEGSVRNHSGSSTPTPTRIATSVAPQRVAMGPSPRSRSRCVSGHVIHPS